MTFAGTATGICVGDSGIPTLEITQHGKPLNSTDKYGSTIIDFVGLGIDVKFDALLQEYKAGSVACFTSLAALGLLGVIGRMYYPLASALVLTAITGTPAQVAGAPNTLTASKAILRPEFPVKLLFGPMIRTVPISLQLLLYDTGAGVYGHFTTT